jgi:hypothetical protein
MLLTRPVIRPIVHRMNDMSTALLASLAINLVSGLFVAYVTERHISWRYRAILIASGILLASLAGSFWLQVWLRASPKAAAIFADFSECEIRATNRVNWGVFNDNPYRGNSNVTIEMRTARGETPCHPVLAYYLGDRATIPPYCGIFAAFDATGRQSRDVSRFSGIQFYLWLDEGDLPENVRVSLHVSPESEFYWYDGYYEYDLTEHARKNRRGALVYVPFDKLVPSKALQAQNVTETFGKRFQKRVLQLAFVIEGTLGIATSGKLAIDDIGFY